MKRIIHSQFIQGRTGWYIVVACGLALVGCIIAGLLVDAKSMVVNLLAGIGCTALGILIAIWVVDRYLVQAARARWLRVDTLTHRAIAEHLCDMTVQLLIEMSDDQRPMTSILEGRDKPDPRTLEGLTALAAILRAVPDPESNDRSDAAIAYYEQNKWDLDQLCDRLSSRVIQYSDEQDLIDALIELDGARRALLNSIIAYKLIVIGGVFLDLAKLVDASSNVYQALLNHWRPDVSEEEKRGL